MVRIAQAYTHKPRHLQSLVSYIARRNENELIDWLESKRIDTGNSTADVVESAMYYLGREAHKGNFRKAIGELYNLHPDKQAILDFFGKEKQESFSGNEKQEPKEQVSFFKTPLFRLLAVVGVIVVLIVIISKMGD